MPTISFPGKRDAGGFPTCGFMVGGCGACARAELGRDRALAVASATSAQDGPNGEGHTPVTICHKPGTPAEHTEVVDDDAVPAHLDHGDYLGPCQ